MIEQYRNTINLVKGCLERGNGDSVGLANYMLRDLDATKDAGLSDLAWAIHKDGAAHKNGVLGLVESLEKYLDGLEEGGDANP